MKENLIFISINFLILISNIYIIYKYTKLNREYMDLLNVITNSSNKIYKLLDNKKSSDYNQGVCDSYHILYREYMNRDDKK